MRLRAVHAILRVLATGAVLLAAAGSLAVPAAAEDLGFMVIVHPDVAVNEVTVDELARIYRKETTRWPDGAPIMPVEVGGTAPTRAAFYRTILKLMVGDVTAYWINQAMTTGNNPPKVFSSDSLVIHYVGQTPGAVGFVGPGTPLDDRVKQVAVRR
jgi:ABC-type phosphate transport system substrate-binding protein